MPLEGEYEPSAWKLVAEQVRQYEATGGRDGGVLQDTPCVILWTRGRSTGKVRKTALIRVEHEGRYAVVASLGGAPKHPNWYLNLMADPDVTLQDGPKVMDLRARTATPEEKQEWWPHCAAVWPSYDSYQAKTERDIPVVLLEPRP
jgi:deazaflavin-dependent oxidoreductase (nitroreductase family)